MGSVLNKGKLTRVLICFDERSGCVHSLKYAVSLRLGKLISSQQWNIWPEYHKSGHVRKMCNTVLSSNRSAIVSKTSPCHWKRLNDRKHCRSLYISFNRRRGRLLYWAATIQLMGIRNFATIELCRIPIRLHVLAWSSEIVIYSFTKN